MAHLLASATSRLRADVIEANEFPALSQRYQVSAVPTTVFSKRDGSDPRKAVGALPPENFLGALLEVSGLALEVAGEDDALTASEADEETR